MLDVQNHPKPRRPQALGFTLGQDGRKQAGRARPERTGQAKETDHTQQMTLNSGGGREGGTGEPQTRAERH